MILLQDLLDEVNSLLLDNSQHDSVLDWKDKADLTLSRILGEDHPYVKEFCSIEFSTSFVEDCREIVIEDTYRLGLEDTKSFLISLIDELESEHSSSPGLMDMETMFAEMNRYVSVYVKDPRMKNTLHHRITCLRDGMISGDISDAEVKSHVENIGFLDSGLFERIVPLLTWFYIQRVGVKGVNNN
ncbi:MAG TPA: hypothetical protein ENN05_03985 [Deltaproteobacteria bacterium]|nr:hypothetical protein [Deltaproteobacteria bacterium]